MPTIIVPKTHEAKGCPQRSGEEATIFVL